MNIWQPLILDRCRALIRFLLWAALVAHVAMFAVFSLLMTFEILHHTWQWAERSWFSHAW